MDQNELIKILNQASRVELTRLPGIGPALAERIVNKRPYTNIYDLNSIKGIGEYQVSKLLELTSLDKNHEQMQGLNNTGSQSNIGDVGTRGDGPTHDSSEIQSGDHSEFKESLGEKSQNIRENFTESLTKLSTKTKDIRENLEEGISELGETFNEKKQEVRESLSEIPEKFEESAKSRGLFWTILISNITTGLLTIVLMLLILLVINGSLKYATGSQYNTLNRQTTLLQEQTSELQQDLGTIRSRLVTLEGFGERTVALEKAQLQIILDVENAKTKVDSMYDTVANLSNQVSEQEQKTARIETFLKDLHNLLGGLFASQGEIQ